MSEIIEPRVLKGFRDILPDHERKRKALIASLEQSFEQFGFLPIDTPILEYTEVLLGKGGGETDKQIYRFEDNGGRDVAMRFDLTVPFARFMAQHRNELYLPFKRYHVSKVFRGENTQRGRYREFMQCDFDVVGVDSASADFDILLVMIRALDALGIGSFEIRISHRGMLTAFLERQGAGESSAEVMRTIDKLGKVGREKTATDLTALIGSDSAEAVLSFIEADTAGGAFEALEELVGRDDPGLMRLKAVFDCARDAGVAERLRIDPSITRGLDYYTGIVFETFLTGNEEIGSVCSGGRYNDLASLYTKERLPGVGSSVGLDRLLAALEERQERETVPAVDVLVLCIDEELAGYYHHIADTLRGAGLSAEVFPEKKKLPQQFSFAERKGIPVGIICGGEERAAGTVTVRDLASRESHESLTLSDAVERARSLLGI
jgi:histidyl-tRNA synthetase